MSFIKRLYYYSGGFIIGIFFLVFIFSGKKTSCNYGPNARVIDNIIDIMASIGIQKDSPKVWFGQLYGMSDNITFNLASENFNVIKYLPYGPIKEVIPYLIRRADENTSVKGQTSRELDLIKAELNRRKSI